MENTTKLFMSGVCIMLNILMRYLSYSDMLSQINKDIMW